MPVPLSSACPPSGGLGPNEPSPEPSTNLDVHPSPSADASTAGPLLGEPAVAVERHRHDPLCQDISRREIPSCGGGSVGIPAGEPTSSVVNNKGHVAVCELARGSHPPTDGTTEHGDTPPHLIPGILDIDQAPTLRSHGTDQDVKADCNDLIASNVCREGRSIPVPQNEQAAKPAVETSELSEPVSRLQEENRFLQGAPKSLGPRKANITGSGAPDEPSILACSAERDFLCLQSHSAGRGTQEMQEEDATRARGGEFLKARRGRAPGAPPRSRGPHVKPQGALASNLGASSMLGTHKASLRLWGWCPPGEPLTSLRKCCADHLLLEGTCASDGEQSSGSSGASAEAGSVAAASPEAAEAAWLLDLEATMQATLKDLQQEQKGGGGSTGRTARDALNSVVEEIGFSGGYLSCPRCWHRKDSLNNHALGLSRGLRLCDSPSQSTAGRLAS